MMDVTDRHCRFFLRQVNSRARLYTEMITSGALIHGDVRRHLEFSEEEHPVALQLGGSEPDDLARCAKLGEQYGYDEINLNIGCPSERVQRGAFGACLMAEPALVASCVQRIRDVVSMPVTVKHRVGIDKVEDYSFVRDFVGTVAQAGCKTFIVHARNAVLKGLSPKENREIPPLKYDYVYRLKRDFPGAGDRDQRGNHVAAANRPSSEQRRRRDDRPRGVQQSLVSRRRRQDARPGGHGDARVREEASTRCATSPATCSASTTACRAPGCGGRCSRTRSG